MRTFCDQLEAALANSARIEEAFIFPTILAPWPSAALQPIKGISRADFAITHLARLGFEADRTRMDLGGYPGLFRELGEPPPWIEVTPEDSVGPLSLDRQAELKPLYLQALEHSDDVLQLCLQEHYVARAKGWALIHRTERGFEQELNAQSSASAKTSTSELDKYTQELRLEMLMVKLRLARCLGREDFEALQVAVFDFDEYTPAVGAPDLFVWGPKEGMWFFAEVKGPGDRLQRSQADWIRANWQRIKGRFVLFQITPAA